MTVLLDECVDWRLLRELGDFDVKTVKQLGWENVKNGALLRACGNAVRRIRDRRQQEPRGLQIFANSFPRCMPR